MKGINGISGNGNETEEYSGWTAFPDPPVARRVTELERKRFFDIFNNPFGSLTLHLKGLMGRSHQAVPVAESQQYVGSEPEIASTSGFVTLAQLETLCEQQSADYLIEDLLPLGDVHIAVGDSGLGKTPWAYQLGLCVATGKPFLDRGVKQGRVLYFDLENGQDGILAVSRSICAYLGIRGFPADFWVLHDNGNVPSLEEAAEDYKPSLIIVDTLRAFRPSAEAKNDDGARFLLEARKVARSNNCAILLLHHVRKPGESGASSLERTPTMEWLLEASGARALINQTHTRIAFDKARVDDAAFVMKHFVKIKGESGAIYLERVCDENGEPVGYRPLAGVQLLGNAEQEEAFRGLPQQFSFKEAKHIYGRSDDPTNKWLKKCADAGLVRKVKHGFYERIR